MAEFITNDGIRISYEDQGRGTPLLFIHGWGASQGVWKDQKEYFKREWRVITCDVRGHGLSGWREIDKSENLLSIVEGDLIELKEHLGLKSAFLVGWSMGGALALSLAAKQISWIDAIAIIGGNAKFIASEDYKYGMAWDVAGRIRKSFKLRPERTLRACFKTYVSRNENASYWEKRFFERIKLPDTSGALSMFDMLCSFDLRVCLNKVKVPALVCHGTADEVSVPEAGRFLAKNMDVSKTTMFESAGHIIFMTEKDRLNRTLERFCRIVESRKQLDARVDEIVRESS